LIIIAIFFPFPNTESGVVNQMTNHIHLALQADQIPLSRGLQNLSFRYTRWINWQKVGYLRSLSPN
jgi:hypothetical protein